MADHSLTITAQTIDGFCVVSVSGRIDSSSADNLIEKFNELITAGATRLLLDLGQLAYLTGAGFRALLIASNNVEQRGGSLALCNISNDVRELFEMAELLDVFVIHGSREQALNGSSTIRRLTLM